MTKGKSRDPIPASFASIADAAEFWDTHDLGEYADQTSEVEVDVKLEWRPSQKDLKRRAAGLSGQFRSGLQELSVDHDRYLVEDPPG